jgi:SAM-dependent methyltransferase
MDTTTAPERTAGHIQRFEDLFRCPACGGELKAGPQELSCKSAAQNGCPTYPVENGIPRLFVENEWDAAKTDVTEEVKEFYEKTPFPNYDDTDSISALIQKSRKGLFARLLDEQIPLGIKVLEAGCGTGQLTNFLGITKRDVFGTDMCLHSLALAENFRRKSGLANVGFYQMNLFRPCFRDETFDLVVTNGVLHHTSDPYAGFRSLAPLVKTGGYIIVGLYNKYGRLMTDLRRHIFALTGRKFLLVDPYLRERGKMDAKTEAWLADQYQHPHESKHTMGEVLKWFDETGFDFVNSIPKSTFMGGFGENEKLFAITPRANALTLAAVQAHMIGTGNREGGLFLMIGKRR